MTSPPYNEIFRQGRVQGIVRVAVRVSPSGAVQEATTVESIWDLYDELHESYARRWRFEKSEDTTEHEIEFEYRFLEADVEDVELGVQFDVPYRVEIRARIPMPEMDTRAAQRPQ